MMKSFSGFKQGSLISLLGFCLATASVSAVAGTTNMSLGGVLSDSAITAKVKAALMANTTTSAQNIQVVTNNGEVTLSGVVGSETEASTAVEIAESTDGVQNVITDNLKVKDSNQPLTDAYITAKVKGKIMKEKLVSSKNLPLTGIKVETQNGQVFLSGEIENSAQEAQVVNIANSVKGVKKVTSNLTVEN